MKIQSDIKQDLQIKHMAIKIIRQLDLELRIVHDLDGHWGFLSTAIVGSLRGRNLVARNKNFQKALVAVKDALNDKWVVLDLQMNYRVMLDKLPELRRCSAILGQCDYLSVEEKARAKQIKSPSSQTQFVCGVYLLHAPVSNLYKIGKTTDLVQRLSGFVTVIPEDIELSAFRPYTEEHITSLETTLHARYLKARVKGEWFALSTSDVIEIITVYNFVVVNECVKSFIDRQLVDAFSFNPSV